MSSFNKRIKGLSLVELLVALALSGTIIAGIIQVFLSNREAFNLNQAMVRSQENGRFAISFLTSNIRQSGSFGCVPEFNTQTNNVQSSIGIANFDAIQVDNSDNGDPVLNAFDEPDELSLLQLEEVSATVTAAVGNSLTVAGGVDFAQNDWFLVSNCLVGDFFVGGAGTTNTLVVDQTGQMRTTQYAVLNDVSTVSKVRKLDFEVDGTALRVAENGGGFQELVDGIENIQFDYGVDNDGDFVPDYFSDIDTVIGANDVTNIVAVKVSVLTVSEAEVTSSPQTITFNAQTVQSPDNRLRRVYESTVILRNRLN